MPTAQKYGKFTKELMFRELKELFDKNEHLFIVASERLANQEIENLRKNLKQTSAKYTVVKNSLCNKVLKEKISNVSGEIFQGQTAIVVGNGDPVAIVKTIAKFAKEYENFKIRCGFLSGEQLDTAKINLIASLPPKEVLIAKVVGGIKAPITGLVYSLFGLLRQLVVVLDRVRQKKS